MSESIFKHTLKTAATLMAFALTFTALMVLVYQVTKTPIAESEARARIALFKQVLPPSAYNNDVLSDTITIAPSPLLGNRQPSIANIAKLDDTPVAIILEAIAHDGYSGDIKLLIAIQHNGQLSGVRVVTHSETPGLGDYIDIKKSDWIKLFDQVSLQTLTDADWAVKKDGGSFDYMAGATITPRAVVKAVHKALQYYNENSTKLLSTNNVGQTDESI